MKLNKIQPNSQYDLVRIGKNNDGGYLVEKQSWKESEFLISLGINDDWSFEKEFGKDFIGIDNQLNIKFLVSRFFKNLIILPIGIFNLGHLVQTYNSFIKILEYSKLKSKFVQSWFSGPYETENITLKDLFYTLKSKNVFLKIDIEGSEYRVLQDILTFESRITGMVIEFHDCDIHMDRIIQFIQETSLTICHYHVNNYGRIINGIPSLIELTFAMNPTSISNTTLIPHPLDQSNRPD